VRSFAVLLAFVFLPAAWADHDGHLVAHISGGVGLEERETFLARRSEFNVHLVFAKSNGEYVAGVETLFAEEHDGHVILKLASDGPFVYARLSPGRYALAATFGGETQRRTFVVPERGAVALTLLWREAP
jgi:hypothetical protein